MGDARQFASEAEARGWLAGQEPGPRVRATDAGLRALHQPVESGAPCIPDHGVPVWCPGCSQVCATCRDEDGDRVPYPCPALAALDGGGEA